MATSRRWYLGLVGLIAVVCAGVFVVLPWLERQMIYFPDRDLHRTPAASGLAFEEVWFEAGDGARLHGWFIPARSPEAADGRALLLAHGNAGNIADRVDWIAMLHRGLDAHLFAYDYRAYGRSEPGPTDGPTEGGLYLDGVAALAALRARAEVDAAKVVVLGRSLGGGVTSEVAARAVAAGEPPAGAVLESTFTSIGAMAKVAFPVLPGLGRLVRTSYDNLAKVPGLVSAGVPVLIVHGGADELIPVSMGHELATAAGRPPVIIAGGGHNDAWYVGGAQRYVAPLREFLEGI